MTDSQANSGISKSPSGCGCEVCMRINRLEIALLQAAIAIGNMKEANLFNFFVRISIRKGPI